MKTEIEFLIDEGYNEDDPLGYVLTVQEIVDLIQKYNLIVQDAPF